MAHAHRHACFALRATALQKQTSIDPRISQGSLNRRSADNQASATDCFATYRHKGCRHASLYQRPAAAHTDFQTPPSALTRSWYAQLRQVAARRPKGVAHRMHTRGSYRVLRQADQRPDAKHDRLCIEPVLDWPVGSRMLVGKLCEPNST